MGDIIDTKDHYIYLLLLIMILVLIIKTDTDVLLHKINTPAAQSPSGLSDWFRESINTYWPSLVGILGIVVFILSSRGKQESGYTTLWIIIFMAVFFTSYTIYQWDKGGAIRGGGTCNVTAHKSRKECEDSSATDSQGNAAEWSPTEVNVGEECSIILPISNQFQTKEYKFFRFIYYLTLIIVASCAANNINIGGYFSNIIALSPFLVPLFMEVINEIMEFLKPEPSSRATLSPELLLIHFMRGKGGVGTSDSSHVTQTAGTETWLEGTDPFFNAHLMFSMIFYIILMLGVVIYSQGFYGYQQSNAPIYLATIMLIGFSFFMRYIFIQECSIDAVEDNLPDTDADRAQRKTRTEVRKREISCIIEKYGGVQMMLCASLIIMILTRINKKEDKALAFGVMILLTYGISQTLISTDVYTML